MSEPAEDPQPTPPVTGGGAYPSTSYSGGHGIDRILGEAVAGAQAAEALVEAGLVVSRRVGAAVGALVARQQGRESGADEAEIVLLYNRRQAQRSGAEVHGAVLGRGGDHSLE